VSFESSLLGNELIIHVSHSFKPMAMNSLSTRHLISEICFSVASFAPYAGVSVACLPLPVSDQRQVPVAVNTN
jgi:hypothetical protein